MLYEAMKSELQSQFPLLKFSSDDEKKFISIPPVCSEVGSIDIQDDYDELTVFVGNFTHWHCGYFDEKMGNPDEVNKIVSEVSECLQNIFNDNVFMWSSAMKGGGYELIDDNFKTNKQGYVWSGPFHR